MKYTSHKSTCSYCGVGCGLVVEKDRKNRLVVKGDPDYPVNQGKLCSKGRNLHYTVRNKSDRLLYPQMRWSRSHPIQRVDWDTAMDRAAAVFRSLIKTHGPESVGFYISGQCLTEEYYLVNKLVKGFIGCNNIDTNSRLCMSSAVTGYKKTFGEDSVPVSYEDIELADCFMIAGANPAWCHPILFQRLEKHKEENPDTKVIVIDPRHTQTASLADLHLQINPGTDVLLFNAIARRLIEAKMWDKDFIDEHTEFFENYRKLVFQTSLRKAAKLCGVAVDDIRKAAEWIGGAKGFISMWAMGLNQSVIGVDKNYALLNLHLITGQVGKPGSGPFSLTGQPNAMGGREVGGMATLLAVHKNLTDPNHRNQVATYWGVDAISDKPGLTATQMIDALHDGKLKAIWIICTNPVVSLPRSRKVESALLKAKFVVVQDISALSDTVPYADLVLPAAGWAEKAGTMTNSERRVSYLPKIIDPPGEALPDAEIICRFARKMGYHGFDFPSVAEVYQEYVHMTSGTNIDITGLSHQRLQHEGSVQYPVPSLDHNGTERLFEDKQFYTPTKKAWFNTPINIHNLSPKPDSDFPFILTTGRIRDQWHTMTRTGKVNKLKEHIKEPYLEMHPVNAAILSLKDADTAVVRSKKGAEVRVRMKITKDIKQGVVFLPMHWGKFLNQDYGRTNNLTNPLVDSRSKQPDFKYTPVQIRKYSKPKEKIVVVGAGAAAYRFVNSYREVNTKDDLHIFSLEPNPFYNRVLLPEYVSERLDWQALEKMKKSEFVRLNLHVYRATGINQINRKEKTITDDKGQVHSYDRLVLATGSRAFVPRDVPVKQEGVFTIRRREDADKLKSFLKSKKLPFSEQNVVIVGGGLLGLEIAAALRHRDINITLVQRAGRLMERQLDNIASKLLAEDVQERGISIYFNNEVSTVFELENGELSLTLKTGRTIDCHVVVYAIGTRPNIELAKEVGIETSTGIIVNECLQTSDPNIYAIGEIAEFKGQTYGITAAAEQQANCCAKTISGDPSSLYQGSILMNILKFEDLNLCSIGRVTVPPNDDGFEEIVFSDLGSRYYKKCIVKDDLLVGAILIGDKSELAEFRALIEKRIELSNKRYELLRPRNPELPMLGKLVCSCNNIGDENLRQLIHEGCNSFSKLVEKSGAGLGCGSCKPEVKFILDAELVSV